jgi:hypothetical protein
MVRRVGRNRLQTTATTAGLGGAAALGSGHSLTERFLDTMRVQVRLAAARFLNIHFY